MVVIKQGVIAIATFNTLNRTIDGIAELQLFLTASRVFIEK